MFVIERICACVRTCLRVHAGGRVLGLCGGAENVLSIEIHKRRDCGPDVVEIHENVKPFTRSPLQSTCIPAYTACSVLGRRLFVRIHISRLTPLPPTHFVILDLWLGVRCVRFGLYLECSVCCVLCVRCDVWCAVSDGLPGLERAPLMVQRPTLKPSANLFSVKLKSLRIRHSC